MSKISLGQLDLQALQQYLEIVSGFRKAGDTAFDVQYVGSYMHPTADNDDDPQKTETTKVRANEVAMAALENGIPVIVTDENGVIVVPERNTVMNSQMLGGKPAEEYMPKEDAQTLTSYVDKASYGLANDIRNLKDELYQLKNQLAKVGTIQDTNVYNGFIDPFVENNQKHVIKNSALVESVAGTSVYLDSLGDLKIDDIVAFENNGRYNVQKISNVGYDRIDIDAAWSDLPIEAHVNSGVKKSLGISQGGKFVFAQESKEGKEEVEESKFIVKDGIDRIKVYELNHNGHGFGTEIIIPASLDNCVISRIHVSLASKGGQAQIKGLIYKINEETGMPDQTSYETEPLGSGLVSGWFNDFELKLREDMPVKAGERYIIVLQATTANAENKWFIGGFTDDNCLDDVHNDCYELTSGILYRSLETKDMYLSLTTKIFEETDIQRLAQGLYTCEFDTYLSKANRIRVELLINQEGRLKVKDGLGGTYARAKVSEIPIETKDGMSVSHDIFKEGDTVIVGKEIGTIYGSKFNDSIILAEDMSILPGADVYRMGYQVQATVSNVVYDATGLGMIRSENDIETYELKLVEVIPGRDVLRPYVSSDRLIFEAEFRGRESTTKLSSFEHVQVQVSWNSNLPATYIQQKGEAVEGALFDITVSVDQANTIDPESI